MDEEDCAGLPCRVETWCSDPLWDPSVSWDTQVRTLQHLTLNLMLNDDVEPLSKKLPEVTSKLKTFKNVLNYPYINFL
jgi:hypothetical protein